MMILLTYGVGVNEFESLLKPSLENDVASLSEVLGDVSGRELLRFSLSRILLAVGELYTALRVLTFLTGIYEGGLTNIRGEYMSDDPTVMDVDTVSVLQIRDVSEGVFIAWRRLSRRTSFLSRELGLELFYVPDRPPYLKAAWRTLTFLRSRKPGVVFTQLPQGPLLAEVAVISRRVGFKVVADVHTGFIYPTSLKEYILNKPFHTYLHKVDLVLAHNKLQASLIQEKANISSEKIMIVYDPIPQIPQNTKAPRLNNVDISKSIVFPASWALDEPLDFIVAEFLESDTASDHTLIITGNWRRNKKLYRKLTELLEKKGARNKIALTGYVQDDEYYHILKSCKAVIAVSKREYTLPHALWEAIAVEKPFITLETETMITEVGRDYPCFFTMSSGSLRKTLEACLDERYLDAREAARSKAAELKLRSRSSIESLRKTLTEMQISTTL